MNKYEQIYIVNGGKTATDRGQIDCAQEDSVVRIAFKNDGFDSIIILEYGGVTTNIAVGEEKIFTWQYPYIDRTLYKYGFDNVGEEPQRILSISIAKIMTNG